MVNHELEIRVHGRVQGVRFRQIIRRKAIALNIYGHVMNRADGSVEIIAQGTRENLRTLLYWLEDSPGFSKVSGINYHWQNPSRVLLDFSVIKQSSFIVDQAKSFLNLGRILLSKKKHIVPVHVAIIPDGNRRWARTRGQEPQFGHYTSASFQHLQSLFATAKTSGVRYLTLWGFSTENWKRAPAERKALFALLEHGVKRLRIDSSVNKIRFHHLGRKDRLPSSLLRELVLLEQETAKYSEFHVQLCLDYGGSDELVRAVNKILASGKRKIDESALLNALDAPDAPPVDLVIRTSGEQRLSGLMPLQVAYAELYFAPVHFPDFDAKAFKEALDSYSARQRRFGN